MYLNNKGTYILGGFSPEIVMFCATIRTHCTIHTHSLQYARCYLIKVVVVPASTLPSSEPLLPQACCIQWPFSPTPGWSCWTPPPSWGNRGQKRPDWSPEQDRLSERADWLQSGERSGGLAWKSPSLALLFSATLSQKCMAQYGVC